MSGELFGANSAFPGLSSADSLISCSGVDTLVWLRADLPVLEYDADLTGLVCCPASGFLFNNLRPLSALFPICGETPRYPLSASLGFTGRLVAGTTLFPPGTGTFFLVCGDTLRSPFSVSLGFVDRLIAGTALFPLGLYRLRFL